MPEGLGGQREILEAPSAVEFLWLLTWATKKRFRPNLNESIQVAPKSHRKVDPSIFLCCLKAVLLLRDAEGGSDSLERRCKTRALPT